MMEEKKAKKFRQGLLVFAALAVLTLIEYFIGVVGGLIPVLVILALVKAGLVFWYYMHIRSVFRSDDGGH